MKLARGLIGFALLVTGAALIYWPAAFLVAGAIIVVDILTE